MLGVWLACVLAFAVLPYQLLDRPFSALGLTSLVTFTLAFVIGTVMVRAPRANQDTALIEAPAGAVAAQRFVAGIALFTSACLLIDAQGKDVFDLVAAYELRSETADALLKGEASSSSIWFQLSFISFPAAYVFIALHLLYAPRIRVVALVCLGFAPIVLATVSMGGRNPIFYALLVALVSWRERRKVNHPKPLSRPFGERFFWTTLVLLMVGGLFGYFVTVFIVRAQVAGGVEGMFDYAAKVWGIGFAGPGFDLLFAVLGDYGTYMLFIFTWYLVQGLVMSNYLFSAYDGPMQLGVYGIEMLSALERRLSPERLALGFDSLLSLGTYGFLPSAWGSLWVDFGWGGLLACVTWGAFTALAWRRIVRERQGRWLLVGPFVSLGILFSVINTPFGFVNGLMTHIFLAAAFLMLKPAKSTPAASR